MILARPLEGLPEVRPGDDLGALIARALPEPLRGDEVVVVAHKVVSKAEGRLRHLDEVIPRRRARELAEAHGKDPRLVQVILEESRALLRAARGVLICETHHGFVCANAGVDASNLRGEGAVLTLPVDPDASARALRARLGELAGARPGVIITDSFGRAWRVGQCDVAIGAAGLAPLDDWRGRVDATGRTLHATSIAVADQLAAVADLARTKDAWQPVVIVSGAARHLTEDDGPGAAALLRARADDLFR